MNRRLRLAGMTSHALFVLLFFLCSAQATQPSTVNVSGTLGEIEGIRVLRVWGEPRERGFAHGYLLADTIVELADGLLANSPLGITLERYTKQMLPKLERMKIDPRHEVEMQGILAGMEAKLGGPAKIDFLKRPLTYEDIVAINCTSDFIRSGCSSFAAWGEMTENGHTIAGRNMDWHELASMVKTPIVCVNTSSPRVGAKGWVGITWPAFVGCLTGMNSEGVTVATHDADGRPPSVTTGFTPYCWTFRRVVELASADTAFEDAARVVRGEISIVGNNMMVTRPFASGHAAAAVLEFDADLTNGDGLTVRTAVEGGLFLICTNHLLERRGPINCWRYGQLGRVLERIAESNRTRHVTSDRVRKMLRGVSPKDTFTYHSVVFEPDKRLMHVAFANSVQDAPECKHVTLDVTKLLAGDYPGGR
ncbi:MAG: hypothetical protein JSU63_17235 [Phycisphaerales bacterium]|nr:MAG: hypothetical protein JSU63_17235 [Phycisphaerales bacterium]